MKRSLSLVLSVLFAVTSAYSAITVCKFYDDRDMAFCWRSDDMRYYPGHTTFDRFMDTADFAESNRVVFTPAILTRDLTAPGWSAISSRLTNAYFRVGNHSYSHPYPIITNYWEEYITSRSNMIDNLDLPSRYTYQGNEYISCFYQFGGTTNIDPHFVKQFISTNDYLCLITGRNDIGSEETVAMWNRLSGYPYDRPQDNTYPPWDTNYNMFANSGWGLSELQIALETETNQNSIFDTTLTSNGVLILAGHQYQDGSYWRSNPPVQAFVEYAGSRSNIWYCSPEELILYRYVSDYDPPDITTLTNIASEIVIEIDGSGLPRTQFGLSFPVTYKIDKPSAWNVNTIYHVKYNEGSGWVKMTERTTNEWFNAEECWRDTSDQVLVSKGLPVNADTMQIMVKKSKLIPAFFSIQEE